MVAQRVHVCRVTAVVGGGVCADGCVCGNRGTPTCNRLAEFTSIACITPIICILCTNHRPVPNLATVRARRHPRTDRMGVRQIASESERLEGGGVGRESVGTSVSDGRAQWLTRYSIVLRTYPSPMPLPSDLDASLHGTNQQAFPVSHPVPQCRTHRVPRPDHPTHPMAHVFQRLRRRSTRRDAPRTPPRTDPVVIAFAELQPKPRRVSPVVVCPLSSRPHDHGRVPPVLP